MPSSTSGWRSSSNYVRHLEFLDAEFNVGVAEFEQLRPPPRMGGRAPEKIEMSDLEFEVADLNVQVSDVNIEVSDLDISTCPTSTSKSRTSKWKCGT
jgi:hypothetical protein